MDSSVDLPKNNYKKSIKSGVVWNTFMVLINQGSGILVKLILARMLVPEYFGLVGMAVVFTGLFKVINESGMKSALIQRKELDLKPIHFDSVFWFSIVFSSFLFLLVITILAPFTAWFYEEPFLYILTICLSISLLINPLNLIHRVKLSRDLNFKKIAVITTTATVIVSSSSIILAFLGAGIWSIVFQSIGIPLLTVPLMWRATKWRPRLKFSWIALSSIFSFSIYTMGTSIVNFLRNNLDYLLIGKMLSAYFVGLYAIVFMVTETTRTKVYSIINQAMFPIYSRMQDDLNSLKYFYLLTMKYNALITFPFFMVLAFFSEHLLFYFLGAEWVEASFALTILALASIVFGFASTPGEILKAIGKPKVSFKVMLYNTLFIALPLLYIGIKYFGINGAAIATLIHFAISRLIFQMYMYKYINVSIVDVIRSLNIPLLGSLLSVGVIYLFIVYVSVPMNFVFLLIYILLAMLLYVLIIYIAMKDELVKLIKSFKK
ncbi:lipopolysaccharide biosynthesis protein [Salisediminibacterium selenitireducens]|uniref:Polysaccharide biosynthesis protein n=1 Tax=Bacillus selenitireducens (strain ATCC 700615 / DSM 15326 / MLS10) TaxID=439292 RepID=D6Y019_BACIE|nr:lipopolysaccharide biosynthesis protein [Salisediminibacterium selenitireducens]ADI00521.1 polysaccharide biosynthesis protein [[Bacillus] selenitireducens MLS10]